MQPVHQHIADPPTAARRRCVAKIQAAWLRFPDFTVVKAAQTYTRLDEYTYRYKSGTFEADLDVDDDGLVTTYAEWRRTAVAMGPNDSEPLDATR